MTRLTFSLRRAWTNDTGNEGIDPLRSYAPTTVAAVQKIVREAESQGCCVRAVGSGHSWSDVALTDGYVIRPDGLRRPLALERELLRPDVDTDPLVRVESGMTIRELNAHLEEHGTALANMGGFDGQTIAGVISTSTHGSGLGFGPLSDFVRSLDIVAAGGRIYRIESADGPTDPRAYATAHPDRELKQDDDWFNAAVVGMGCLGVITSVILTVVPAYYLREVRTASTWTQVRGDLADGVLDRNVHYEVLFSPYHDANNEISCLVTTRNPIPPAEYRRDRRRARNWFMELSSRLPITPKLINLLVGIRPSLSPYLLQRALNILVNPDYVNVSYKVLNIGAANYLPAYSSEIGVAFDERRLYETAVETVIKVANQRRELGDVYHSSPISLRFVKASEAHMSMMHGRNTMMIELIMATHTVGGFELLTAHENALYDVGGRPHWGQVNSLTGSAGLIGSMYPAYDAWQDVHAILNASGVFTSPFTKRTGISEFALAP
jgi:hypothetical protein